MLKLIDHVLTKREELNTLRAIYAQYISRIDARLKTKFSIPDNTTLHDTIEKIPPSLGIDKNFLHEVRLIRNGLMHNDEEYCTKTNQYTVKYQKPDKTEGVINENELEQYRAKLNQAYSLVMDLP